MHIFVVSAVVIIVCFSCFPPIMLVVYIIQQATSQLSNVIYQRFIFYLHILPFGTIWLEFYEDRFFFFLLLLTHACSNSWQSLEDVSGPWHSVKSKSYPNMCQSISFLLLVLMSPYLEAICHSYQILVITDVVFILF